MVASLVWRGENALKGDDVVHDEVGGAVLMRLISASSHNHRIGQRNQAGGRAIAIVVGTEQVAVRHHLAGVGRRAQ